MNKLIGLIPSPVIKQILKCCVLALFAGASITSAYALKIKTKGGPKLKTEDGNFELGFNARAHLDVHSFNRDGADERFPPFGSQLPDDDRSGFNWRRTYTTLSGKFYELNFKLENDFAAGSFPGSLRENWLSARLGPGEFVLGQFKPYRGMEELTSSNEITMMERPSTSSTGIYAGRQFLVGMGYKGRVADQIGYAVDVMTLANATGPYKGLTYGGRLFWIPFAQEGKTLHLGFSVSRDDPGPESLRSRAVDIYGGRLSISKSLGVAGAGLGPSNDDTQTTWAAEAAYAIGPVTLQGEYANARLDNTHLVAGAPKDSTIQAYYVQASWFCYRRKSTLQEGSRRFWQA